ncbi:MAG: hypothetical protein EBS96_13225 [Spartobacteria bacterium]|nr:hypothetical protein [Spartobacteria bacterium]
MLVFGFFHSCPDTTGFFTPIGESGYEGATRTGNAGLRLCPAFCPPTPDQSPEDDLIHRGIYQLDAGVAGKAKKLFHRILSSNPSNPQALEGMRAAEPLSAKP